MAKLRTVEQRKADVMSVLQHDFDLWLATADPMGRPHLIAASGWWDRARVVMATIGTNRTARNLAENSKAKLALGSQSDAILIDAELEDSVPAGEADEALAGGFLASAGWDPGRWGRAGSSSGCGPRGSRPTRATTSWRVATSCAAAAGWPDRRELSFELRSRG